MFDYYSAQCAEAGSAWNDLDADLAGLEYASICVAQCLGGGKTEKPRWADMSSDDEDPVQSSNQTPLGDSDATSLDESDTTPLGESDTTSLVESDTTLLGSDPTPLPEEDSSWRSKQILQALQEFTSAEWHQAVDKEQLNLKMLSSLRSLLSTKNFFVHDRNSLECVVKCAEKLSKQGHVDSTYEVLCEARQYVVEPEPTPDGKDRCSKTELPTRGIFHEPQQFATCSEDGGNCCKTKVNSSSVAALGVQKPILRPTGRRHQQDAGRGRQQLSETVTGKYQCQFIVGIEEERKFKVMRKLLGPSGANMRAIVDRTGAKLRLRGKGSRFLEGPEQVESSDPLMLCVSVTDRRSYDVAVSMAWALMERVHQEDRGFCFRSGREVPELHVQVHEGARAGAR